MAPLLAMRHHASVINIWTLGYSLVSLGFSNTDEQSEMILLTVPYVGIDSRSIDRSTTLIRIIQISDRA